MTRKAERVEQITALLHQFLLIGGQRVAADIAGVGLGHGREQVVGNDLHPPRGSRRLCRTNGVSGASNLEEVQGQHRLNDDVEVGVFGQAR
jgi:hypothetical protein